MATQHDGINPHTAADLLRKAMLQKGYRHRGLQTIMHANRCVGISRSDEETHDHIGSSSTTPSGVATPNPNPTDKRFPGIIHSYFGQVGTRSSTSRNYTEHSALPIPETATHNIKSTSMRTPGKFLDALHTASSFPNPQRHSDNQEIFASPLHQSSEAPKLISDEAGFLVAPYPTPPISSPASVIGRDLDNASDGGESFRHVNSNPNVRADSHMGEDINPCRPAMKRHRSGNDIVYLPASRISSGLAPLSNIISCSSVHAAHISNPATLHPSTAPNTPTRHLSSVSALSSLTSFLELTKLTNVAALSRFKNTPPLTPRALSNDGIETTKGLPPNSNQSEDISSGTSHINRTSALDANASVLPQASAPVGPPKGKLYVNIVKARGLRPSHDPYVVCVFEWTQSIAKEPRQDEAAIDKDVGRGNEEFLGAVPIRHSGSDMGRSMAIPMKSRQSSTTSLSDHKNLQSGRQLINPSWDHEAVFDVLRTHSDIDVYVYDRSNHEAFLGHVKVSPNVSEHNARLEGWYKLEARDPEEDEVSGEIRLELLFQKTDKKHYGPEDFQILKLIGKGTFGQVYQVRKKDTQRIYAMKVLSKKVIVQKKEVAHTLGERNILVRTAMVESPFIVGLKFSFQTPTDLYLVTGFMSGGELFWHLQKEGRFSESRAKFYIAELILALQHLHKYDIVYRDLKPENILLDANGHIALCDFGLSKANLTKDDTTNTFCGTTEYLAPEVLLDEQGYTTMVDFWSLGVLVFEMCCGWSPFYADDTQQMYKNIAFGKVRFPRDALSNEGRNFVKGLLNRNPKHRLGARNDAEELKAHAFFADTDWNALKNKMVVPPFKPKLKSVLDTSNFDPEFTNALQTSSSLNARAAALAAGAMPASTPLSPGMQANFQGFTFVDERTIEEQFKSNDLDRMEEDEEEDDSNWEQSPNQTERRGDRMSGIIKTGENEDYVFNDSSFDV